MTSVFGTIQVLDKVSNTAGRIQVSNIGVTGVAEARDFTVSSTLTLTGAESAKTVTITKVYDIGDNSTFVDPTDSQGENVALKLQLMDSLTLQRLTHLEIHRIHTNVWKSFLSRNR